MTIENRNEGDICRIPYLADNNGSVNRGGGEEREKGDEEEIIERLSQQDSFLLFPFSSPPNATSRKKNAAKIRKYVLSVSFPRGKCTPWQYLTSSSRVWTAVLCYPTAAPCFTLSGGFLALLESPKEREVFGVWLLSRIKQSL